MKTRTALILLALTLVLPFAAGAQIVSNGNTGGSPTGTAGGDLSGTYPNPTVAKVTTPNAPINGATSTGGIIINQLATPTGLAVTHTGTSGTTHWCYRVSALDNTGETLAETEVCDTTGNASLSTTPETATWSAVTGAVKYNIYGNTTGAELKMTPTGQTALSFVDNGTVTPSGALPSLNSTGPLTVIGRLAVGVAPFSGQAAGDVFLARNGGVIGALFYGLSGGNPVAFIKFGIPSGSQFNLSHPMAPPVAGIASLPVWASTLEGAHAVANNCDSACSAGSTCTHTSGSTHCEMYYNSSALVETGN